VRRGHNLHSEHRHNYILNSYIFITPNTLGTGDADMRFYITTVQDGCRKSAFL